MKFKNSNVEMKNNCPTMCKVTGVIKEYFYGVVLVDTIIIEPDN